MTQPPPRIRRDPRDPASMRVRVPVAASAPRVATVVMVPDPACLVMAVVDLEAGRLSRADREVMGAARQLADSLGGAVVMTAFLTSDGELRAKLDEEGADRRILLPLASGGDDCPEARVAPLVAAADLCAARHILFGDSFSGAELARRVAARLDDRAAFQVRRLAADALTADIDAGLTDVTRPLPRVIVIAASVFAPVPLGTLREARPLGEPARVAEPVHVRPRGTMPLDPASVPLTEAELILSAGGGLTDWPAFHSVAASLGAAQAGSRVVCDAGLLPRSRQVGVSGQLVEPRCYIALGIAGASQHLQGVAGAERVIAINSDPRSDMIRRSDLAIVADVQAVLPALARLAAARTQGGPSRPAEPAARPAPGALTSPRVNRGDHGPEHDIVVLSSLGRHPVSKRLRRAERDARALELALSVGSPVTAIYAGPAEAAETVLRDHIGAGAADLTILDCAAGSDPLPALEAELRMRRPALIFAGARAEAGECSGMTPFWLAERLGIGVATNVVAFEINDTAVRLVQALPGGRRRLLDAAVPLIVTVDRSGPEPRLSARLRALRATPRVEAAIAVSTDARIQWTTRQSRPRPKRLIVPTGVGQVGAAGEGRREMLMPEPEQAAEAILAFLERDGLIAPKPLQPTDVAA